MGFYYVRQFVLVQNVSNSFFSYKTDYYPVQLLSLQKQSTFSISSMTKLLDYYQLFLLRWRWFKFASLMSLFCPSFDLVYVLSCNLVYSLQNQKNLYFGKRLIRESSMKISTNSHPGKLICPSGYSLPNITWPPCPLSLPRLCRMCQGLW